MPSEILKFDAHVKKNCTTININSEVDFISISLQNISGLYSGIDVAPATAWVYGELHEQLCIMHM